MEWLLIFGLAVWLLVERRRIDGLERRLDEAERRGLYPAPPAVAPPPAEPEPQIAPEPAPTPFAARIESPSVVEPAPPPRSEPKPEFSTPVRTFDLSGWLAENGLAWLGGGALALGGLFLVVYAAQAGVFTPPLRIAAAVLAGGLMLAASEWIRRRPASERHPLAAAAAAGAGGATLYGAIWAAQQLYHLVPFEVGAGLIVLCSAGLLAYALLHGEALAVLALFGAFAAPLVTGVGDWRSPAPEAFLSAIIATGFAFCALRRWAAAGYATTAGAVLWAALSLAETAPLKAALLLLAMALGAVLAAGWSTRRADADEPAALGRLPLVAIVTASLLAAFVWTESFAHGDGWTGAVTVGLLAAIAAVALVRRLIPADGVAAPVGAAGLGLLLAVTNAGPQVVTLPTNLAPLFMTPVILLAIGWTASLRLSGRERLFALASAALGAAFIATVVRIVLDQAGYVQPWAASGATAAVMFAAAWPLARRSGERAGDRGLALWLADATELGLIAVAGATPTAWEPAAHALAAGALVVAALRLRWSGLDRAAVAAALVSFGAVLTPPFIASALGAMPLANLVGATAIAAAILFAAGWALGRPAPRAEADALRAAALFTALLAAFLVIERLIAGPAQANPSPHLAAGLRTVLMLAAALMLVMTRRPDAGRVSLWRLRLVLGAGIAHGLLVQVVALSPWWGYGEAPVGPPLVNTLLITELAPALLLAAIWRRGVADHRAWTRACAVAAFLFALVWAVLAVRHGFHAGGEMDRALVLRNEGCAYVVLILAAACALVGARRLAGEGSAWLASAAQPAAMGAMALAALTFGLLASPWWGEQGPPLSAGEAFGLFGLYVLAAAAAFVLQRLAGRQAGSTWPRIAQAGMALSVLTLFALLTLLVRYAFHGGQMQARYDAPGLETWAYSAAWALFGLAVLVVGGLRRHYTLRWLGLGILLVTVAKVGIFDTSRLDGMIRAASFLGLGVLLIVGALAARRLNARALLFAEKGLGQESDIRLTRPRTPPH